jgi:hypothetical protein
MHANVNRSGEGYSGGIRMLQQALTHHAAATIEVVENSARNASIA